MTSKKKNSNGWVSYGKHPVGEPARMLSEELEVVENRVRASGINDKDVENIEKLLSEVDPDGSEEEAHMAEDELAWAALKLIRDYSEDKMARKVAATAMQSLDIDFYRYYA